MKQYHYDRRCRETNDYLNDEAHIIYVNGTYQDSCNSIGRLMHDFKCVCADEMYNQELAERFRYFKETEGGIGEMCKIVEERAKEYAKEYAKEQQIENIKRMLDKNKYTQEEIAENLNVSVELVKEIANGNVA